MSSIHKQPVPDYGSYRALTTSVKALGGWVIPNLWRLLLLFLMFFGNVSPSNAQDMNFRSERKRTNGYRAVSAKLDFPTLQLNSDTLQSSATSWSKPIQLFRTDENGQIHSPFAVSDLYGNIHVFWTVYDTDESTLGLIYYMRLDSTGWTTPVDIIAADVVRSESAAIGQDGYIYLIWNGAGGTTFSRAPLLEAEFVRNWSRPVLIAESGMDAGITTAPSGKIHVAYPGIGTSGVFEQFLEHNNQAWSSSRMVAPTSLTNTASDYAQIRVSNDGTLHVVWTEFYYPDRWPPRGVYYARSIDGGNTWSAPQTLAGDGFDQVNISLVDDNNVHVAWNGMAGLGGRYHRWSSDGGETWSETVEVIPAGIGGTEGLPQLVVDEAGTVHMLTTHQGGCLWYTYFQNRIWASPTCISEERTLVEEPSMTVSEGNKLHAVFWDNRTSLWYTTMVTNAAWVTPKPIENEYESTQNPVVTDSLSITPTLQSAGLPMGQELDAPSKSILNPGQILILSLSPAILLILFIVALSFYKKLR